MRADDLDHKELLELDPEGGVIRFATQFGFAHGWRMAEAMKAEFKWNSDDDWQRAGTRIHALEGLFRVEAGSKGPLSKEGVTLLASYEAEQHLLHFGRSDVPVCWTICGLTSGYVSRSSDKEIYVLEDRCMGKGDAACHLIGRTRQEWGDERAEELRFFEAKRLKECLDVSICPRRFAMRSRRRWPPGARCGRSTKSRRTTSSRRSS
jgi:two-component system, NtrC family, response regulator HydG